MTTSMWNQCLWHEHGAGHAVDEQCGCLLARVWVSPVIYFANYCIITSIYMQMWSCTFITTLAVMMEVINESHVSAWCTVSVFSPHFALLSGL